MYFFGISRLVLEFIRKIDLRSAEYLFTVVTRGGSPGCALRALRKELEKKSKTLHAGFSVNFWTNYVLKYQAPSENRMRVKSMKARGRVEGIARVIEAKGRCHPSGIGAKDLAEFRDGGRLR